MLPEGRVSTHFLSYRGAFIALAVATAWFVPLLAADGPRQQGKAPSGGAQAEAPKSRAASSDASLKARVRLGENYGKLPLRFEPNQGQTDKHVHFLSRGPGYALFLTGDEAVLALRAESQKAKGKGQKEETAQGLGSLLVTRHSSLASDVLRLKLAGADANAQVVGLDELPGKSNYFRGNDPKKWRTNVPNYGKVKYEDVYPGVDLVYYGNQRQLEYDFVVAPGADPRAIRFAVETGNSKLETGNSKIENRQSAINNHQLTIDSRGDLVISTDGGEVRFHKPTVYQPKSSAAAGHSAFSIHNSELLDGRYRLLAGNQVGFEIPSFDRNKPLVIDPVLSYATYLGGSDYDYAYGVAVDSSGSAYVTGTTISADFPTASPLYGTRNGLNSDAFVTKMSADGSSLIYSTYLGGSQVDQANGIAVDSAGSAYLTGYTYSNDFPTANPFQGWGGGIAGLNTDAFVSKLSPLGDALVYSSYLGGTVDESGSGIAVDSVGSAYVVGYTTSTNFPTMNPMQGSNGGLADAFVTKVRFDGGAKLYSTYLGGSGFDYGYAIAVDSGGNVSVTGSTSSTDFPTLNPFQDANGGTTNNAFITKLDGGGAAVYSTYLGGTGPDYGTGIAVDSAGNAYVTGLVTSLNFPVVNFLPLGPGGGQDIFVSKIDAAGAAQVYTAILGGSASDAASAIAVDANGSVHIAGTTGSSDYPLASPVQDSLGDGTCVGSCTNIVVSKINAAGNALIFSSYLGGTGTDRGNGIWVDPGLVSGEAFVAGSTTSTNFPETTGAFQETCNAGSAACADAVVAKLSGLLLPVAYLNPTRLNLGSVGVGFTSSAQTVTLENRGDATMSISSVGADGDFAVASDGCGGSVAAGVSCIIGVTLTPTATGTRSGSLTITDNAYLSPHVVNLTGTGLPAPAVSLSPPVQLSFPDQVIGTSSVVSDLETVTLTNTGTAPLTISSITTTTADFAISSPNTPGAPACLLLGGPLGAGASCRIPVVFMPTTTGVLGGSLTIADDAPPSGSQTVALLGRGLSAGVVSGLPASLDFGTRLLDSASPPQTVTLTNTGAGPIEILDIYTTGDFYASTTCPTSPASLAALASCEISVVFIPSSAGSPGGTLVVATDADAGGAPHTVSLTGTGIADVVKLFPRNLLFGERPIGDTSPAKMITVTNTGSTPVTLAPVATSDFALVADTTAPCGASLDAGASCTIDVTFTPTVDGRRDGTLTITTDALDSPEVARLIGASAIRDIPGFEANVLPRNDDQSTALIPLPFTVNFFGNSYSGLYVNNNGNVTFDSALSTYTPFDLTSTNRVIIAPFFADVDTMGSGSSEVTYGTGTVNGRPAFGVNWINVGYYSAHDDKLNSIQLVLIDRSDIAPGNFDFEMNYAVIDWETGDASDGIGGLGGSSARAGYSNGTGNPGTFYELEGSAVNGAFLDSNLGTGLIHRTLNGSTPGGYRLLVRNGEVVSVLLSPNSVNFPGNPVNLDCDPKPVTVTNTGQTTLTITGISLPPGSLFSQTNDCPATLVAGVSCTISVKFHGTVPSTTPVSDTLTVATDAPGPSSTVALTGIATAPCGLLVAAHAVTVLRGTESASFNIEDHKPSCTPLEISLTCTPDHPAQCALAPTEIAPGGASTLHVTNLRAVEADSVRVVVNSVSEFRTASEGVSVLLSSFAFTSAPDTASVMAGETADYALTIRPVNGLSGAVALGCSGAPRGAQCTVTPASLTLDGTSLVPVRLRVTTTGRAGAPGAPFALPPLTGRWGLTLLGLLSMLLAAAVAGSRRRRLTAVLLAGTLLMLLGWAACGGGGGAFNSGTTGTPAGTYALTVTGTFTNAPGSTPGTLTNSTTVTLHVN